MKAHHGLRVKTITTPTTTKVKTIITPTTTHLELVQLVLDHLLLQAHWRHGVERGFSPIEVAGELVPRLLVRALLLRALHAGPGAVVQGVAEVLPLALQVLGWSVWLLAKTVSNQIVCFSSYYSNMLQYLVLSQHTEYETNNIMKFAWRKLYCKTFCYHIGS